MRRIAVAVAVGFALVAAIGVLVSSNATPAPLLTGASDSCWAGGAPGYGGVLMPDATYGTAMRGYPVMWPVGYSARREVGGSIEVLNARGAIVARTGRVYYFSQATRMGYDATNQPARFPGVPVDAYLASADCGYLWGLIDCTAVAQITGDAAPDSDLGLQRLRCATIQSE